jgi:hypothetical protein
MVPDRAPMDYSTLTRTADLIENGRVRGVKNAHWCSAAKVTSPHISMPMLSCCGDCVTVIVSSYRLGCCLPPRDHVISRDKPWLSLPASAA